MCSRPLLAIALLALLVPRAAFASCEDGNTEGWAECDRLMKCGGSCEPKTWPCKGGTWYTEYVMTKPCPQPDAGGSAAPATAPAPVPSAPSGKKAQLFKQNRDDARQKFKTLWSDLAGRVKNAFNVQLADADLNRATDKMANATLLSPDAYNAKIDQFPGNDAAKSANGFTTPAGDIYIRDTVPQDAKDSVQGIIGHEGVHSALTGHNLTDEQEEQVAEAFIKGKWSH